ncbi:MAG TPA: hypothetical protein VF911_01335, partial [Thermoanaerobaculia bacterium]
YALGLDAMITTSHDPFLPNALTDHLNIGNERETVISSEIFLEVSNDKDQVLTIRRPVAGGESRYLVNVWNGPAISEPDRTFKKTDYYVRQAGAATQARGFHSMLAHFVGWSLPTVPRFNGDEVPLYVEAIFPLLFVEQKKGWASVRGRFPTHFGIRDVWKRSLEFLLDLDAYELAVARQTLRNELDAARAAWKENFTASEALARVFGAVARYLPEQPTASWPPQVTPRLLIPRGADLDPLKDILKQDETRLAQLVEQPVPDVGTVADQRQVDLQQAEIELAELQYQATTLVSAIEQESAELDATRARLEVLRDDIRRMKDTQKLIRLGSDQAISALEGVCPTCRQQLHDDALHDDAALTMPLDDNLKFVDEQIAVFQLVETESLARVASSRALLAATNRRVAEVRGRIRALRATLVSDPRLPSMADVEERINLETRVREFNKLLDAFDPLLARFAQLSSEWADLQTRRMALGDAEVSDDDEAKLSTLEKSFRQQLRDYGFSSEQVTKIVISRSTYQPESAGFDVEADASASDMIRVIWSYMLGLLEVARTMATNHLDLLVFDEPRQQSTAKQSFQRLVKRAALAAGHDQQVIFATSEELTTVRTALKDLPHTIRTFDRKLLQPLEV